MNMQETLKAMNWFNSLTSDEKQIVVLKAGGRSINSIYSYWLAKIK